MRSAVPALIFTKPKVYSCSMNKREDYSGHILKFVFHNDHHVSLGNHSGKFLSWLIQETDSGTCLTTPNHRSCLWVSLKRSVKKLSIMLQKYRQTTHCRVSYQVTKYKNSDMLDILSECYGCPRHQISVLWLCQTISQVRCSWCAYSDWTFLAIVLQVSSFSAVKNRTAILTAFIYFIVGLTRDLDNF